MLELLFWQHLDTEILRTINSCHAPALDWLMWWISDRLIWIPLYLTLAAMFVIKLGWVRALVVIGLTLLVIGLTDQVCASMIRPYVERLRPSNLENPINTSIHIVNGYRGGRYGFPSCHAANTFALAIFLSLFYRRRYLTISLVGWSLVVSFSRVYLGVHYPGDVIIGSLIGAFFATLIYILYTRLLRPYYLSHYAPPIPKI